MCQFLRAPANGRAAQSGDRGQSRDAATTALQCEDGGDPPARRFVGQGEELVQGGVVLGDIPLGMFAALEAGADMWSPAGALRRHDGLTRVEETTK
jgi:hypothetical protein